MRGRIINPFLANIGRLDTVSTAADPDGAGELTSGYDDVFREPVRLPDASPGVLDNRKEYAPILIPCQFEGDDAQNALQEMAAGNDPKYLVRLIFHFQDLEELDLVDGVSGEPLIHTNDRLISMHRQDGTMIQKMGEPTGLFCTEVRPVSFGLVGGDRNLLILVFGKRDATFHGNG